MICPGARQLKTRQLREARQVGIERQVVAAACLSLQD
jgi:hypothetical protein